LCAAFTDILLNGLQQATQLPGLGAHLLYLNWQLPLALSDPQEAIEVMKKKRAEILKLGKGDLFYWAFISFCGDIYLYFGMKKQADKMFRKMRRSPHELNVKSTVCFTLPSPIQ